MSTEKHSTQEDVIKEEEETETYTKRNDYFEKFQLLVILGVVIGYSVYGIIKVIGSYDNPSTKYSEKGKDEYDMPWLIGCMNGSGVNVSGDGGDYYFGVYDIYANGTYICDGIDTDCGMFSPANLTNTSLITINSKHKYKNWTIYDEVIYDYSSDEDLYCYLIVPPSDLKIHGTKKQGGTYEVTFDTYREGMFYSDITFNSTAPTPAFLVKQYQFSLEHQIFHPDQFYKVLKDDYGIYDGDEISIYELILVAYDTGNDDFYAPICSRTDLQLELYTTKYYSGSKQNEYSTATFGATIDTTMYYDGICQVGLFYYPKIKSKDRKTKKVFFQQNWAEEYLEYDEASLFAGIGGIVGIVQSVFGVIMPIILLGLSISWLKINFGGLAPYPRFDDAFEFKLARWLRSYLRQHRNSVQNIIKIN